MLYVLVPSPPEEILYLVLRSQPTGHFFNLCMTSSPIHIRYLWGADCGAFFVFDPQGGDIVYDNI